MQKRRYMGRGKVGRKGLFGPVFLPADYPFILAETTFLSNVG